MVLFTAQPSAFLKSIYFGLRHSRGLGFQCALPHDDDLAPTEPACWLGEVCEVLLHCLLPVHYTVNLDHNTGSIFFNTDFILKRAETLKPVSKNCDEMPPVNLEVLELISYFFIFNIRTKPTEFSMDFSSPVLLLFFVLKGSEWHRQHSVRKTITSWFPHRNTMGVALPGKVTIQAASPGSGTPGHARHSAAPASSRGAHVQASGLRAPPPQSKAADRACLCLPNWFSLSSCTCLFAKKYQENKVLLSSLFHLAQ